MVQSLITQILVQTVDHTAKHLVIHMGEEFLKKLNEPHYSSLPSPISGKRFFIVDENGVTRVM